MWELSYYPNSPFLFFGPFANRQSVATWNWKRELVDEWRRLRVRSFVIVVVDGAAREQQWRRG